MNGWNWSKIVRTIDQAFVIGRKNGLHPYNDLKYLFEQLPQLTGPIDVELEPFLPMVGFVTDGFGGLPLKQNLTIE